MSQLLRCASFRHGAILSPLLAALFAAQLPAQFVWQLADPGAPPPRSSAGFAWDPVSQRGVLFGGVDLQSARADTWVFEVSGGGEPGWRELDTPTAPGARFDHAMATTAGGVLLFGGMDDRGRVLGDTWLFDGTGWRQVTPAAAPSPRAGHAMGYDPVLDRALLFGGGVGTLLFDDTWEWSGSSWQRRAVPVPPPGMRDAAMAFDPATLGLLMHGTSRGVGRSYTWDGRGWWPLVTDGPARRDHQMVFDPATRSVLIVGGREGSSAPVEVLRFRGPGPAYSWVVDGRLPVGRRDHSVLRVPGWGRLLVTAGRAGDRLLEDNLQLDRRTRDWNPVVEVPAARKWFELLRDPVRDRAFLFGGFATGSVDEFLQELWSFGADGWRRHAWPAQGPEMRIRPQLVHDAGRDRLVVCGGRRLNATYVLPDTWEFDPSTGTWQRGPDMPHGGLTGGQMVYDGARDRCVLFGGSHTFGAIATQETWAYDGGSWQLLATDGPPADYEHRMAYVPGRDEIVLVAESVRHRESQTWVFDGVSWSRHRPQHQPPTYGFQALVHQPLRDRCTLVHPVNDLLTGQPPEELWEWDGVDWTRRDRPSGGPPAPLEAGVFLDHLQGIVQFGGSFASTARGTWALQSADPADAVAFGAGCPDSTGVAPELGAVSRPWVGDRLRLAVRAARIRPGSLLWFGASDSAWSGGPLPQDLSRFGFTGCRLLVSDDVFLGLPSGSGTVELAADLPSDPALVGLRLFAQAMVVAAGANPAGGTTTNGLELRIGSRD